MTDVHSSALNPMVRKFAERVFLSPAAKDALLNLPCKVTAKDAGSYLVREGAEAEYCVLVLSGFVYLRKMTGAGGRQILAIHLTGDLLGVQAGLIEKTDHSVQALTFIKMALIPRNAVLEVAAAYAAVAQVPLHNNAIDASITREWLLNVGRRDARQRISYLLFELALRQEAAGPCEGPDYELPMTQEQIADAIGLTAVHVNRVLQGMRGEKLIRLRRGSVSITDWSRLRAAGDFGRAYLLQPPRRAA